MCYVWRGIRRIVYERPFSLERWGRNLCFLCCFPPSLSQFQLVPPFPSRELRLKVFLIFFPRDIYLNQYYCLSSLEQQTWFLRNQEGMTVWFSTKNKLK